LYPTLDQNFLSIKVQAVYDETEYYGIKHGIF
jgi:hypothetical protein